MATLPRPIMRAFRALPNSVQQRAVRAYAPSYTLGAQARVRREDGRILLVKAAYRWRWGLPGGLLSVGEGPAEAVVRETLEETGLEIDLTSEPVVVVEPDLQRINFIFDAVVAAGQDPDDIRAQPAEILEIGWFDPESLPETIPDATSRFFLQASVEPGPRVVVTTEVAARRSDSEQPVV